MKIVRIIARLNVGGPARHVVWLTRELQGEEFRSVLLTGTVPPGEEDMGYFAEENGVEPVFIEEMSRELSLRDAVSLWKIYRQIRREKPDIIHTHTAKAGTVGRMAGFIYRWLTPGTLVGRPRPLRLIHTYHGHVFHSYYGPLKTNFFLFIEKTLARLATDKIVVISRRQFEEIHDRFGVGRADQFAVIPLGIDLDPFDRTEESRKILRREIGAADEEVVVGLIGRLTEVKNIGLLLKTAGICRDQKKIDSPRLRFVIIGDGHLRKELEDRAGALKLGESVQFLGNRNDPEVFYAGLDIVALTSRNEGTPLSLIEAMAGKKAVISTTVGGVPDLLGPVEAEKNGFSVCQRGLGVASDDAEGLYRGIIRLAEDRQLRQSLGESGREFVVRNYSRDRLVKDIKNLYLNVTGTDQKEKELAENERFSPRARSASGNGE
ncbi:MAG: glycosyltransferase [Pyrinomonadaceae bacterium]